MKQTDGNAQLAFQKVPAARMHATRSQEVVHGEGDNLAAGREHAPAGEELIGWSTAEHWHQFRLILHGYQRQGERERDREAAQYRSRLVDERRHQKQYNSRGKGGEK